ncbi:MAG: HepT-like ribonuclease domain-containing protein [Acidimicrobiales bacterium]
MSRSDEDRIADMLEAARELAAIVSDGESAWEKDRIRQLAAERLLEIIGESARALSPERRDANPGIAWTDIIGLRTLLAHHYHRVDPQQVWVIATEDVPRLVEQLEAG